MRIEIQGVKYIGGKYEIAHNRATRPCQINLPMLQQWIRPMGDECVFIKLHITAQPGPVKLIFQCYSNGSALWVISVCVCVFIKLHTTAKPGPVKRIFQCYSNGSAQWGISVCVCVSVCVCLD